MDEIEKLKEMADAADSQEPLSHGAGVEFLCALRAAWPTLLARIEAGERLAEAGAAFVKHHDDLYANNHFDDWTEEEYDARMDACDAAKKGIEDAKEQARAALAAFAKAKESKHAGGAK